MQKGRCVLYEQNTSEANKNPIYFWAPVVMNLYKFPPPPSYPLPSGIFLYFQSNENNKPASLLNSIVTTKQFLNFENPNYFTDWNSMI